MSLKIHQDHARFRQIVKGRVRKELRKFVSKGELFGREGGKTVSEVYAERAGLNGQAVTLRGKVVKAMSGIMGKNWLHVKDGSGAAGTDDLVVTTLGTANVGDTVLVKGNVAALCHDDLLVHSS